MSSSEQEEDVPSYVNRAAEESDDGGVVDSSEEEEDDDEEEMQKIRDGFIVDDEDEDVGSRKRHKKRKRNREREVANDDALDEDDLDLLLENTGGAPRQKSSNKLKRLKRGSTDGDNEEGDSDSQSRSRGGNTLDAIFSDDDDEIDEGSDAGGDYNEASSSRRNERDLDEMDDFIEEDSDVEDDGGDNMSRGPAASRKKRQPARAAIPAEYSDMDQEKLDQLFEIFGDGEDYQWALDLEEQGDFEEEEGEDEAEGQGVAKLTDVFESAELKEKMLTEADNIVRVTDVPERFQEARSLFKNYKLSPEEFAEEKIWVQKILGAEKVDFLTENNLLDSFNQAVDDTLGFICEECLEVPFIWTHRRDFITHVQKDEETGEFNLQDLLTEDNLWRIVGLDTEFHSLLMKKKFVVHSLEKLGKLDDYKEEIDSFTNIQEYQDFQDYISFKYSKDLKDLEKDNDDLDEIDEDEEVASKPKTSGKSKLKSKVNPKNLFIVRLKDTGVYEFIEKLGITSREVGANFGIETRQYFTKDSDEDPQVLSQTLADDDRNSYSSASMIETVVEKAFAEELYHEPKIRAVVRDAFAQFAVVNVKLTEKGKVKIIQGTPNYEFKYLINKEITTFIEQPDLFLRMVNAENESLITIDISISEYDEFVEHLFKRSLSSDGESEISIRWNEIRKKSLSLAMKKIGHLVSLNVKEDLIRKCTNKLFFEVRGSVLKQLNQAPYKPPGFALGAIPTTLTLSFGEGNFNDAVVGVLLNEYGEVSKLVKIDDNPFKSETFVENLISKVRSLKPDVIGINGYNPNTKRLYDVIKNGIEKNEVRQAFQRDADYSSYTNNEPPVLDVIFVPDDIARRFENSERAKKELPDMSTLYRYCVALGRYLQSPLLEYINMKDAVSSLLFHKYQYLLSADNMKYAITTAFVDIVNLVGVDINRAIREPYYGECLQYVAGLGPRKASGLIRTIANKKSSGLVNRAQLVALQLTPKTIFMNCASFLKIVEDTNGRYIEEMVILDETRIHPEDYELATKMAADALELDEEDIDDLERGEGVIRKLEEGKNMYKLNELILEDYALELEKRGNKKRATLHMIKEELQNHYDEFRNKFHVMTPQEIFSSLTGETSETFYPGVVCTIMLKRISNKYLLGTTQFMVSCNIAGDKMFERNEKRTVDEIFHVRQAVRAKILQIDYDEFKCEGSVLKSDVSHPESSTSARPRNLIEWDEEAEQQSLRLEKMKLDVETKPRKYVKHTFFHNFNSRQAEQYLASLARGDLVIRPSSRGSNHLAVTWKVDQNMFQHLDVVEKTIKSRSTGEEIKSYVVNGYKYSDLDELITFHVSRLAKFVESMVNNDRFHKKSRAEAENYLDSYIKANSGRGYYIFCFDHKYPGWFTLLFKGSEKSKINSLPIEVTPNGYKLYNYEYASVALLTNGFKKLMKAEFEKKKNGSRGGAIGGNSGARSYNNAPVYNRGY